MSKQLDIVIPLGPSKIDWLDLRYALRGIENHVKNYRDIWLIGQKPSWVRNVKHLPHSDNPKPEWKERNIWSKIMAACLVPEITEEFAMWNDDHLIIDDIDISTYPYYYKGTLWDSMLKNKNFYRATCAHGKKLLERRGFEDRNADGHCPIRYVKSEFVTTFESEHWNTKWGYPIKSLYCAFNRKEMVYMEDCKLKKKYTLEEVRMRAEGRHVISCTDAPLKAGLLEFLQEKFPQKSKYEQ